MKLSEHRNHQILKETQFKREKTPYKRFHEASGSVAAGPLLTNVLSFVYSVMLKKNPHQLSAGNPPKLHRGSGKDTAQRNIQLHGESISKATSIERLRYQAGESVSQKSSPVLQPPRHQHIRTFTYALIT